MVGSVRPQPAQTLDATRGKSEGGTSQGKRERPNTESQN